jgi:hypothetical protein
VTRKLENIEETMPDYRKMLALLYEAAAGGCWFQDLPRLGIHKWKSSCETCEEGDSCPARAVVFQAFAIELSLEPEDAWQTGNVQFLKTHPLAPVNI